LTKPMLLNSMSEVEAFSATVEKIYDAAIDPNNWETALAHVRQFVNSTAIALHYASMDPDKLGAKLLYQLGFSEAFLRVSILYERAWAIQCGMLEWKTGEVVHLSEMLPREEFLNGIVYKNVIEPHGELDYMGMVALKESGTIVPFTVSTTVSHGPFKPENIRALQLLAPHITRAVKISLALEMKSFDTEVLEATLNGLQAGVFVVGNDGRISFMNHRAEQQVKSGRGFGIKNGCIVPKDTEAAQEFGRYFSGDRARLNAPDSTRPSVAFPDVRGGLVATLLPLGVGHRKILTMGAGAVGYAVFVQDPAAVIPHPGEGFAKLHGLTSAELRVVMAMTGSSGISEAADILGLSNATIKTHLRHLFAKTGSNSQSELMQIVLRSMAPLAT
jgi:DNA-binding CsgD family transcriptional regulator/PAS domain-containing protein